MAWDLSENNAYSEACDTVRMNACMNIHLNVQFLSQIVINTGMVMED